MVLQFQNYALEPISDIVEHLTFGIETRKEGGLIVSVVYLCMFFKGILISNFQKCVLVFESNKVLLKLNFGHLFSRYY